MTLILLSGPLGEWLVRTDGFDLLLGLWGLWMRMDDFDSTLAKCGLYL